MIAHRNPLTTPAGHPGCAPQAVAPMSPGPGDGARAPATPGTALLVTLSMAQFMVVLDFTIVNVALPSIQRGLQVPTTTLQWLVSGYAVAFGGCLLLGGRLADVFGKAKLYRIGMCVFVVASIAGGFAVEPKLLVTSRIVQGIGASLLAPAGLSLLVTSWPDEQGRSRRSASTVRSPRRDSPRACSWEACSSRRAGDSCSSSPLPHRPARRFVPLLPADAPAVPAALHPRRMRHRRVALLVLAVRGRDTLRLAQPALIAASAPLAPRLRRPRACARRCSTCAIEDHILGQPLSHRRPRLYRRHVYSSRSTCKTHLSPCSPRCASSPSARAFALSCRFPLVPSSPLPLTAPWPSPFALSPLG